MWFLNRKWFLWVCLVVVLPGFVPLLAVTHPDATQVSLIDLEFDSPAYRYYTGGYYYINEDGYDHWAVNQDVGNVPDITSSYYYSGSKGMICSVGSASSGECARSELLLLRQQTLDTTMYCSFANYQPVNSPETPNHSIFWQCWQWSGGSPPLALNMEPDGQHFIFQRNVDDTESTTALYRAMIPEMGSWHRYFVEYTLGTDYDGNVKFYIDGIKKMEFEGTTARSGTGIPTDSFQTKCGIYRYSDPSSYTSYFDSVRIGTARSQVWYGTETEETQPESSIIGHWGFDEPGDCNVAIDSSEGCSYVGEIRNGGARAAGYIGGAVSLDGVDDYVSIPDSILWDTGDQITVSCRFKTDTNQSVKGLVMHDYDNYKYMLYMTGNAGDLIFYVRTSSGVVTASINNSDGYYADSAWHHVTGVYDKNSSDGNRVKLYVDGSLVGYAAGYNESILAGDEGIKIGRYLSNYFDGQIDDVRIYNYALGLDQVTDIYSDTLLAHWKFDDDSYGFDGDCSGNATSFMAFNDSATVSGYEGSAADFDGNDDYLEVFDSRLWDTGSELTVSCRFKTNVNQSGKGLVMHDASNYKYLLYLNGNSGDLIFYTRTSSGVTTASVNNADGYYADGNWHQAVGVYDRYASDGYRVKLYIDGSLVGYTAGYNEDLLEGDQGIYIGRYSANYFDGAIDDVSIYCSAFSSQEIGYMYDGPVCDYDFDENSSDVIWDSSFMNNYDGIMQNGLGWASGYTGTAADFDGSDDYIKIADSDIWDTGDEIAVSCRFKTSVNQSGKGLVMHDASNYKYLLYLTGDSGGLIFYVRTASGVVSASKSQSAGYYADGQWHQAVGVYDRNASDGNRVKLYFDDTLVGSASGYDEALLAGDEGIYIGRYSSNYFDGLIDDVLIYNSAR
ncbi:MAG: LamG-like jellyroll fold domain-containing protein [Sedimentisphaeraceae bacterium JB056]